MCESHRHLWSAAVLERPWGTKPSLIDELRWSYRWIPASDVEAPELTREGILQKIDSISKFIDVYDKIKKWEMTKDNIPHIIYVTENFSIDSIRSILNLHQEKKLDSEFYLKNKAERLFSKYISYFRKWSKTIKSELWDFSQWNIEEFCKKQKNYLQESVKNWLEENNYNVGEYEQLRVLWEKYINKE